MLTIRKECRFEAAHLLNGHPGECRNLHGHTYRVVVEVAQRPDEDGDMVMDFKDLKAVLREEILERFDHAFLYDRRSPEECEIAAVLSRQTLRAVALPFRTTAENLARHVFETLESRVAVIAVTLYETPESCAEFRRGPRMIEGLTSGANPETLKR